MKLLRDLLLGVLLVLAGGICRADDQFRILILAIPNKYHYEYIPVARESFERLAKLHAFAFDWTNQPQSFEGNLAQYAAVVFLNTSGEELSAAQREKFEAYMREGGNAVVVHRGIIMPPGSWPWYEQMVGRTFTIHPMLQTAVVNKVDKSFPATFSVPDHWIWSDEWYEFSNPYHMDIHPVLAVDEASYDPRRIWPGQVANGMGKDHPVSWYRTYEKGRVFVSAMGHNVEMYKDPQYLGHLWGGLWWAATGKGVQAQK